MGKVLEFLFWMIVVGVILAILRFFANLIIMPLILGLFWYVFFEYFMGIGPIGAVIGVIAGLFLAKDQLKFDLGIRPKSNLEKRIDAALDSYDVIDEAGIVSNENINIPDELEKLLHLKNTGALSEEEFQQAKVKILNI